MDLSARTELTVARRRVLELIETARRPMTAAEVASALDLHHNTVREHLDALVDAGFVEVSTMPTGRRGRPALRYASTAPNPEEVLDSYLTLLDAIADTLGTGEKGQEIARAIGRRWAQLEAASTNSRIGSHEGGNAERLDGGARLLAELAALGFAPEATERGIILRACPLVTEDRVPHPLVCMMHEGYLNEVFARHGLAPDLTRQTTPEPDGPRSLAVIPLCEDGCHVVPED